ncbi:YciI family protein [Glutamicibacter ardleyensis]|uniref:YciI family protein n=1 Tax=Glutamicibacter ardleyensis TaxID=225894 RepID=UPI003FD5765F
MTVFAVEYEYAQDSTELRNEHRPAHRAFLTEYLEEVNVRLLASGPTPVLDGALLIFAAANEAALKEVLALDPFNKVGGLAKTTITEWNPVIGLLSEFAS